MVNIIFRDKVSDFGKWKAIFEEYASARKEAGCQSTQVFRNGEKPNEVVVLLDWDNIENFKKFGESKEIQEAMQKMDLLEKPSFYFSD